MSTFEIPRMVVCERCSRPTGEFSTEYRTTLGSCCANLPAQWPIGGPNGHRGHDDDEDVVDLRARCPDCGSMVFAVTEREYHQIDTRENDNEDSRVWINSGFGDRDVEILCYECDRDVSRHVQVDWI